MSRNFSPLAVLSILMLTGCAALTQERQSWAFVTSAGGLELGTPTHARNRWLLPARVNVSGVEPITQQPTTMNSALVCDEIDAKVEGQDIYLVVVTTVVHGDAKAICPAADLGALSPGTYNVFYGEREAEKVSIGVVRLAL